MVRTKPMRVDVWREFEWVSGTGATAIYRCKHCLKTWARSVTRFGIHLEKKCRPFIALKAAQQSGNPRALQTLVAAKKVSKTKSQQLLIIPKIGEAAHAERHTEAAMACYMSARPFSLYKDRYMKKFLAGVSQNTYEPPSERQIAGDLLEKCYKNVTSQVNQQIARTLSYNFTLDESTDINHNRIINLSVVIPPFGSFFLANIPVEDDTLDSQYILDFFFLHADKWVNGDYTRINAIATDTCAVMRSFWRKAAKDPRMRHAFYIPCDSHGLQLLVKDILKLSEFKDVHKHCKAIAKGFRKAKKQYAILRTKQQETYKQFRALALCVITRWGSQWGMICSVLNNEEALRLWVADPRAEIKNGRVKQYILDPLFWDSLKKLALLIKPLHEAQKMSESNKATLGDVVPRWNDLKAKFQSLRPIIPQVSAIIDQPHCSASPNSHDSVFDTRMKVQTLPIHAASYYLTPTNVAKSMSDKDRDSVIKWLMKVTQEKDWTALRSAFWSFRTQKEGFHHNDQSWMDKENPVLFWRTHLDRYPELAIIATRIFETIANSVPSERAFSCMNLVHSKQRNRLGPLKVAKLVYIYMNQRTLDSVGERLWVDEGVGEEWIDKTEKEKVDIESEFFQDDDPPNLVDSSDSEVDEEDEEGGSGSDRSEEDDMYD